MRKPLVALVCLFVTAGSLARAADDANPRAAIIDGVTEIAVPGVPGPLCVFDDAFAIVTADVDGVPAPVIAAAPRGKGHLVALGHEGYFSRQSIDTADTKRLLQNLIEYAASGKRRANQPIRVAHYQRPDVEALAGENISVSKLQDVRGETLRQNVDVIVAAAGDVSRWDLDVLDNFIRDGGGMICGVPGWGWLMTHPGKSLRNDLLANELFARSGILWGDGTIDVPPGKRLPMQSEISPYLNGRDALTALSVADEPNATTKPARTELDIAVAQLLRCIDAIPPGHFQSLQDVLQADVMSLPVPSSEHPLTSESGLKRLRLAAHLQRSETTALEGLRAERCAEIFPGEVNASAPRVSRELTIDSGKPGWHSTGLYAPPGEVVRVTVHGDLGPLKHAKVRIGAHSDRLWHLATWKRAPQIDRVFDLTQSETRIGSGFGGLIYVEPAKDAPDQVCKVTIDGAVEAPLFSLGKTDPKEWLDRIRHLPAPWAELASEKIIITIPSKHVRSLDDPAELMGFWDRVADACADLATIPRERVRPERYVTDVQISAGYMHSGYPIMTHLDAAPRFVDLAKLSRDGDWGMFHEIGHNHQSRDWTFDGTGEVTVNLFTMYVLDTVCTDGMDVKLHKAMSPESRAKAEKKYRENGSKFEQWKREPFTALIMYKQLQEAFGWDAYKRVFAEYRALAPEDRPKTDDEKRDQWMVRFSRTVGRNLGPFFEDWGIPTSEAARKSISDLPGWMPERK